MIPSATDLRIAALREYAIMDTPPEEAFDDICRLTTFIAGTPIALVTLLDRERQWFKSRVGLEASETPIGQAFCAHAIQHESVFIVPDATKDARFAQNPLVTADPFIRFYAGAPLMTPQGVALGTLCAIDRRPRTFSAEQEKALEALARQVMAALELRLTVKSLDEAQAARRAAESEVVQLRSLLPMCAWCRRIRDDEELWLSVEEYVATHTEARFSHGICPDCDARVRTEMGIRRSAV